MLNEKLMIYDSLVKGVPFFTDDVRNYLIDAGYFEEENLFEIGVQRTRELLSLTEKLQLKWSRSDSPYIIGLLSEIYKLFYNREVVIDEGEILMGTDKVINRKTKQIKLEEFYPESLDLSVFMMATMGRLTEEEIFCVKYLDNPDEIAISHYSNIIWVFAVNRQVLNELWKIKNFGVTVLKADEY